MRVKGVQNLQHNNSGRAGEQKTGASVCPELKGAELSGDFKSIYNPGLPLNTLFKSLAFCGSAPSLVNMTTVLPNDRQKHVKKTKDGSFLINKETDTRLYYGEDAKKYLEKTTIHEKDTQIIIPANCKAKLFTDGREIDLVPKSTVLLRSSKEAVVEITEGFPMVLTSERAPEWYDEYTKDEDYAKRKVYDELIFVQGHAYAGHINKKNIDENVADKLIKKGFAREIGDTHIGFEHSYTPEYFTKLLREDGFSDVEIQKFLKPYEATRNAALSAKQSRRIKSSEFQNDVREMLLKNNILTDLKDGTVYWRKLFQDEVSLKDELTRLGIKSDLQDKIVEDWKTTNKTGFDYSGLTYSGNNVAVYELDKKISPWLNGKTEWVTNSEEAILSDGKLTAPYLGVSIVSSDAAIDKAINFRDIRAGERLHSHPGKKDGEQTEIYIITDGSAELTVIGDDNDPKLVNLKAGESFIVQPGVKHCVTAIKGKYEQIVCQVPSTFQYGFGFKQEAKYPEGCSEKLLTQSAIDKLEKEGSSNTCFKMLAFSSALCAAILKKNKTEIPELIKKYARKPLINPKHKEWNFFFDFRISQTRSGFKGKNLPSSGCFFQKALFPNNQTT